MRACMRVCVYVCENVSLTAILIHWYGKAFKKPFLLENLEGENLKLQKPYYSITVGGMNNSVPRNTFAFPLPFYNLNPLSLFR
jgi:hypothetical protein